MDASEGSLNHSPSLGTYRRSQPFPVSFWTKPINRVGLLTMTAIQTQVRVPTHVQPCSMGFPVGFRVTTFQARFRD